jgi:hypothetical protein
VVAVAVFAAALAVVGAVGWWQGDVAAAHADRGGSRRLPAAVKSLFGDVAAMGVALDVDVAPRKPVVPIGGGDMGRTETALVAGQPVLLPVLRALLLLPLAFAAATRAAPPPPPPSFARAAFNDTLLQTSPAPASTAWWEAAVAVAATDRALGGVVLATFAVAGMMGGAAWAVARYAARADASSHPAASWVAALRPSAALVWHGLSKPPSGGRSSDGGWAARQFALAALVASTVLLADAPLAAGALALLVAAGSAAVPAGGVGAPDAAAATGAALAAAGACACVALLVDGVAALWGAVETLALRRGAKLAAWGEGSAPPAAPGDALDALAVGSTSALRSAREAAAQPTPLLPERRGHGAASALATGLQPDGATSAARMEIEAGTDVTWGERRLRAGPDAEKLVLG